MAQYRQLAKRKIDDIEECKEDEFSKPGLGAFFLKKNRPVYPNFKNSPGSSQGDVTSPYFANHHQSALETAIKQVVTQVVFASSGRNINGFQAPDLSLSQIEGIETFNPRSR